MKWRLASVVNKILYDDLKEKYDRLYRFVEGSTGYFTCSPDGMYAVQRLLEETKLHYEVPSTEVQQTNPAGD